MYYLVKEGRIDIRSPFDEADLQELLDLGQLVRSDVLSDCKKQRSVEDIDFLFPKRQYRIAVYGQRGTGKTSFLACCTRYGKPLENDVLIIPNVRLRRAKTLDGSAELKEVWTHLTDSAAPKAPMPTETVRYIDFSLANSGNSWDIRTIDYAGDLLHNDKNPVVKNWFHNCDGVLFFMDKSGKSDFDELHRFLLSIRVAVEKGLMPNKPVAVVLTRSDLAKNRPSSITSTDLSETLRTFRLSTCVFSMSVFGSYNADRADLPARDGPRPEGVVAPLLWLLQQIDTIRFESMGRRIGDEQSGIQPLPQLKRLHSAYQREQGTWGGSLETMIDSRLHEIEATKRPLEEKARQHGMLYAIVLCVLSLCVLFIAGDIFLQKDEIIFHRAHDRLEKALSEEDVLNALRYYNRNFIYFFRKKYYGAGLDYAAERKLRHIRCENAKKQLDRDIKNAIGFEEVKRLYEEFLEDYSVSDYPDQEVVLREVEESLKLAIDEERRGIVSMPREAFAEKIRRIEQLLRTFSRTDPRREELMLDRNRVARDWDAHDYRKVYERTKTLRSGKDLAACNQKSQQYLSACLQRDEIGVDSRFRDDVQAWTDWFDRLKQEHALTLRLRSVQVPQTFFKDPARNSGITISLQVGSVSAKTAPLILDDNQKKNDLVRFMIDLSCTLNTAIFQEGKSKTTIRLTVSESWGWIGGAKAVCLVSDSPYPFLDFAPLPEGDFVFVIDDKIEIRVRAELEGFDLPKLPRPWE